MLRADFLRAASILFLAITVVGTECPDDVAYEIEELHFGLDFDGSSVQLRDTVFPSGTEVVYYEVVLSEFLDQGMFFNKKWARDGAPLFESSAYIPKKNERGDVRRIIGELRLYAGGSLDDGRYRLEVEKLVEDDRIWKLCPPQEGVVQEFRIGG